MPHAAGNRRQTRRTISHNCHAVAGGARWGRWWPRSGSPRQAGDKVGGLLGPAWSVCAAGEVALAELAAGWAVSEWTCGQATTRWCGGRHRLCARPLGAHTGGNEQNRGMARAAMGICRARHRCRRAQIFGGTTRLAIARGAVGRPATGPPHTVLAGATVPRSDPCAGQLISVSGASDVNRGVVIVFTAASSRHR